MNGRMKAAVMPEPGVIQMETRDIPVPKDNEVLIRIKHVGICGSDVHYYKHGRIGDFVVTKPIILGHESAGEIVELGKDVKNLEIGQNVAVEPGIPCGSCSFCMQGKYNLCPDVVFLATPPYDGAFVEYIAYPANMVFKLPEGMDTLEGALIEPLAVGFHAAAQAGAKIGHTAVILGAGCIGLVTLMTLKTMGVSKIFIVDLIPGRLEKAKELGAAYTIKADEEDAVEKVLALTDGEGADIVFETAGSRITTQQTANLVKRGGTIVLVGMAPDGTVSYDMSKLISKEASIHTVFRYRNMYPPAIEAVAAGSIPLKDIVTHAYKFEDTGKAMEYVSNNQRDIIKGVIEF